MATREHSISSPDTHERAVTQALTRGYAINWEVLVLVGLLLLALITRFYDLGTRVMSHDESLHTYYSWRLFEFGEFSHTPLMHGPLLFHMIALSYFLFGDSDFSARLYPAVLGVLIVGFPWLFRRWMGRTGALIAAALLLISPQIMYYNRYIREDTPTIFFTLVTVYAIVQYVDGVPARRLAWLWLLAVGLIGMLASKEVAFIYVAIFGMFLVVYWLLRMVQDVGIQRRPDGLPTWEAPWPQRATGHALLLIVTFLFAVTVGNLLHQLLAAVAGVPSAAWIIAPLFAVVYLPLALSGVVRRRRGVPSGGAAAAIMDWLGHGRSAFYTLAAGLIIGAAVALWIAAVIDVIKPGDIWVQTTLRSEADLLYGQNATKEFAVETGFNGTMFVRLLTWVGLPLLGLLFWLFLSAVFVFPGKLALPWRTMLNILLIALLVTGGLVMFERITHINEATGQPFAADPTAVHAPRGDQYDNTPIIVAWVLGTLITLAVIGTRLLTNLWDFLNRQPIFDVLIVIGALIFPWLTGFPLFWAGYNLEDYNPNSLDGRATLEASLAAVLPFLMVAAAVGLAWNWRRFLPAAAIFLGIFAFFFTTVFSNQYGLVTGMIGSLGYWLEQQEVRRGSQPQYYYLLTQLLVYDFLPLIGALGAGGLGLVRLWRLRRERALDALEAAEAEAARTEASPPPAEPTLVGAQGHAEALTLARDNPAPHSDGEPLPRLARPFAGVEELARRAADREWIGGLPFLAFVGWWAVAMLLGLTKAGEKMPWLTTHITVPLILITGWWLGQVVGGVRWRALGASGWLVLIGALPLALLTLGRGVLGLWGGRASFGGRSLEDLIASGSWLGALLILGGAVYVIWRLGRPLGWGQLARVATLSGALLLAVLTARAAVLACFINYDYPTEFLVYAHSGPAVKTVLGEVDRIATITNEGSTMRIVFDDQSPWPFTWYFRDYTNYGYLRGEAGSVDSAILDGARIVVVGGQKVGDVRRILGDRYYEFDFIRLWWPMQEYFNLNYNRVANVFSTDEANIAAPYYRQGMWDIWWSRDYSTYGQAMCIESKQFRCEGEANLGTTDEERAAFRRSCEQAVINECAADDRFAVNKWPVSEHMYFFVDKQIAAQVWDAGIGSSTVNIREPEYPEDRVFREIAAERTLGEAAGMIGPRGIALDEDGAIYVADTDRNRIAVFSPEGEFLRGLGDPATAPVGAALRQPWGLDVGPDGLVYVADTWNNRVAVLTSEGDLVRAWGHEGVPASDPSPEAMWGPRELKIGPDGLVYVADTGGKRIRVYTPEGEWLRDIGSGGTGLGQVDEPVGLAFNPVSHELYVAEAWNKRIQVFDLTGMPLRTFDVNMWFRNRQSFNRPYLAFSPDGTLLYVVDMDDRHRIVAYNLAGQPAFSFNQADNLETGVLGVRSPAGLAVDEAGRVYVVDADQARVYVFPPPDVSGSVLPVAPADALAPPAPDAGGGEILPPAER
jgi:predicted membrane-bound mannosyltransferase/DNA-binding beta-propeller fold protein YncE